MYKFKYFDVIIYQYKGRSPKPRTEVKISSVTQVMCECTRAWLSTPIRYLHWQAILDTLWLISTFVIDITNVIIKKLSQIWKFVESLANIY